MAQARSVSRNTSSNQATIAGGTRVRGRITGDGDLTIDGHVEGEIALRGDLTIGDTGVAASNVEAQNVVVTGQLEGDVSAAGQVRIGAGSRMRGNVRGGGIAIEDGAQFAGRIDCEFDLPPELEGHVEPARSGRR